MARYKVSILRKSIMRQSNQSLLVQLCPKKPGKFIVYFDFEEDEIVNTAELFFGQNWT